MENKEIESGSGNSEKPLFEETGKIQEMPIEETGNANRIPTLFEMFIVYETSCPSEFL